MLLYHKLIYVIYLPRKYCRSKIHPVNLADSSDVQQLRLIYYDVESKTVLLKENPEALYISIKFDQSAEFCH